MQQPHLDEELQALRNECFCLAFELETLSGVLTKGALERWVPGFCLECTEVEHASRYSWVSRFVAGKRVLDISCGAGRGSYMLAEDGQANEVLACDIDPRVVKYAAIRNQHDRVTFDVRDAETFCESKPFDVIISFETIEHIGNVEHFLNNMKTSLSDTGKFFVSTPISAKDYDESCENPHHLREWGFIEFHKFIAKYFDIEQVYIQIHLPAFHLLKKNWRLLLYPPTLVSLRYLSRFLLDKVSNKVFKTNQVPYSSYREILQPDIWSQDKYPIIELGKVRSGYQILQCKKK